MHRVNVAAVTVVVALGLLVAFAFPASAQSVTAYEGALLIVGDGRVIENATLVVEGARIAQVGPAADVRVPAGATRVSLAGKTVRPMIVDTHTHLSTTRAVRLRDLKHRVDFGGSAAPRAGVVGFARPGWGNERVPGGAGVIIAAKGIPRVEPGRPAFQSNSEAEARKAVQENAAYRADIIKV